MKKNSVFAQIFEPIFFLLLIFFCNPFKISAQGPLLVPETAAVLELAGLELVITTEGVALVEIGAATIEGVATATAADAGAALLTEAAIAGAAEGTLFTVTTSASTSIVSNPLIWASLFAVPTTAGLINISRQDHSRVPVAIGPVRYDLLPDSVKTVITSLRQGLKIGDKASVRRWKIGIGAVSVAFERYKTGLASPSDTSLVRKFARGDCWGRPDCLPFQEKVTSRLLADSKTMIVLKNVLDSLYGIPGWQDDNGMPKLEELLQMSDRQLLVLLDRFERSGNWNMVDIVRSLLVSRRGITGESICDLFAPGVYTAVAFSTPNGLVLMLIDTHTMLEQLFITYGEHNLAVAVDVTIFDGCRVEISPNFQIGSPLVNVSRNRIADNLYILFQMSGFGIPSLPSNIPRYQGVGAFPWEPFFSFN